MIGLDGAEGMLEIARREVPEAEFIEADFTPDPARRRLRRRRPRRPRPPLRRRPRRRARRVAAGDGSRRPDLALRARSGQRRAERRARIGLRPLRHRMARRRLSGPRRAGGLGPATPAGRTLRPTPTRRPASGSPTRTRSGRGSASARFSTDWSPDRIDAFARDLMAASPRGADGSFRLPFGAQYLTARRPA